MHSQADNTEHEAQWPVIPVGLPSAEKRQRIESPSKPIPVDDNDEEWEQVNATDEDVDGDDEDYVDELEVIPAPKKSGAKSKQSAKGTPRVAGPKRERRPVGKYLEPESRGFGIDEEIDDAAEPKQNFARKKPAAKTVHKAIINVVKKTKPSTFSAPIDLTGVSDVLKGKQKKAPPKSTPIRRPAEAKKAIAAAKAVKPTKKAAVSRDVLSANAKSDGRPKSSKGMMQNNEAECIDSTEGEGTESDEKKEDSERLATPLCHIWTSPSVALGQNQDATGAVVKQDFLWDDNLFTDSDDSEMQAGKDENEAAETAPVAKQDRPLGKRQMRSVQQSQIRQNLMMGNLDPHTMVQCESYRLKETSVDLTSRNSRGSGTLEPPFQVRVHPDATFICDLHAHLATCEIIGFLGGRWNETTKTLDIQAAFPCRSLIIDGDDGSTDVEMDPGSEVELRGIIENAQLEVVGWYHSHPAFAPDPSIRDIENQGSYQQFLQRRMSIAKSDSKSGFIDVVSEPFVGLIVGTYDTRRDTPVSLFRYFHVRNEKVSSSNQREISMPYELVPSRRRYRSVIHDEKRAKVKKLAMYPSVFKAMLGKDTNWTFKAPVLPPLGDEEIYHESTLAGRPSKTSKPVSLAKKRKPSFENVNTSPKAVKRGRPRGRPPRKLTINEEESVDMSVDASGEQSRLAESKRSDAIEILVQEISVDTAKAAETVVVLPVEMVGDGISEIPGQTSVAAVDNFTMQVDENKETKDVSSVSDDVVMSESVAVSADNTEYATFQYASEPVKEASGEICGVIGSEKQTDILTKPQDPTLVSQKSSLIEDLTCVQHVHGTSCVETVMEDVVSNVVAVVNQDISYPQVVNGTQATQSRHEDTQVMTETTGTKCSNIPLDTSTRRKTASSTKPCLETHKLMEQLSSERVPPPGITVSAYNHEDEVPPRELAPVISQAHSNPGSANGRRRNRKPVQTVKKQGFLLHAPSQDNTRSLPLSGHSSASVQDRSAYAAAFQVNGPIIDRGGTISTYSGRENTRASHDSKITGTDIGAAQDKPDEYIYDVEFSQHVNEKKPLAMKNEPEARATESELIFQDETVAFVGKKSNDVLTDSMEIDGEDTIIANVSEIPPRIQAEVEMAGMGDVTGDLSKLDEKPKETALVLSTVIDSDSGSLVLSPINTGEVENDIETSGICDPLKMSSPVLKTEAVASASSNEPNKSEDAAIENRYESIVVAQAVSSVMEACLSKLIENDSFTNDLHARELAVAQVMDVCLDTLDKATIEQERAFMTEEELPEEKEIKEETTSITEKFNSTGKNPEIEPDGSKLDEDDIPAEPTLVSVDDNKVELSLELSHMEAGVQKINPLNVSPPKILSSVNGAARTNDESTVVFVDQTRKDSVINDESALALKSEMHIPDTPLYLRCGADQNVQDIQTSLASVMPILMTMKEEAKKPHGTDQIATTSKQSSVTPEQSRETTKSIDAVVTREQKVHNLLHSLRTKYGTGSAACAEQAITLIDYYRKFERRTELRETWKGKTNKLAKIEASLMEYVQRINVPVALRQDFVKVRYTEATMCATYG